MTSVATLFQGSQDPLEMTSLSTQVYDRLRTALMSGDLKPDQRLKIRELATKMGTSETPVREAIAQLSRDGAIEVKPRYFVRVRRVNLAEYLEIRDIRLNLEPLAAERALPHITPANIAELTDAHRRLVEAERSHDWQTAVQCNFEFHFGLYWRAPMPNLISILEALWVRIGPLLSELYPDAHPTYAERHQHENVLTALRTADAYGLREAIRQDLIEGGRKLLRQIEANENSRR